MARNDVSPDGDTESTTERDALDGEERPQTQRGTNVALNSIMQDTVDIRNAVAFAERSAEGRVLLELDHAVEDLSSVIERLERAHAAANVPDNGGTDAFEPGDRAFINETDGGEVIVLATPDVRAENYIVPGTGETVADYNADHPDCSPDNLIVQIVFVESIEAAFGSKWTDEAILDVYEGGSLSDHTEQYAYPDTRLTNRKSYPEIGFRGVRAFAKTGFRIPNRWF